MVSTSLFGTKKATGIFFFLVTLISFYILSKGAILAPDSSGYINMSPSRSLLYPLFLKASLFVFGGLSYGVVITQTILGIAAISYFIKTLKDVFPGPSTIFMTIFIFAFVPYFLFHGIGNYILTEALCYPLSLFFASFTLLFLKTNRLTFLGAMIFCALLLTLTRSQFLFLWPAILITVFYTFYKTKKTKAFFTSLALAIAVMGGGQLLERAYSKALTGNFKTVPFLGHQLVVLPFYLSAPNDIDLFDDSKEKAFFKDVSQKIIEKGLHHRGDKGMGPIFYYADIYNTLYHGNIVPSTNLLSKDPYIKDAHLLSMSFKLMYHHLTDYIKFYAHTLIWGFGDYWTAFLLGALTFLIFIRNFFTPSLTQEYFLLLVTLHLGNVMLISFVEPILTRYTLYTAVPLWSFLIIILYTTLTTLLFHKKEV